MSVASTAQRVGALCQAVLSSIVPAIPGLLHRLADLQDVAAAAQSSLLSEQLKGVFAGGVAAALAGDLPLNSALEASAFQLLEGGDPIVLSYNAWMLVRLLEAKLSSSPAALDGIVRYAEAICLLASSASLSLKVGSSPLQVALHHSLPSLRETLHTLYHNPGFTHAGAADTNQSAPQSSKTLISEHLWRGHLLEPVSILPPPTLDQVGQSLQGTAVEDDVAAASATSAWDDWDEQADNERLHSNASSVSSATSLSLVAVWEGCLKAMLAAGNVTHAK
jgi:hypothetical protein